MEWSSTQTPLKLYWKFKRIIMNRAIMILRDSLEWNKDEIKNAKQSIDNGCFGQRLADCKQIIEDNTKYNKDIEQALEKLK